MRRVLLFLAGLALITGMAAVSSAPRTTPLILKWARKGRAEKPPITILIEVGLKDKKPVNWSGKAEFNGATVVRREGYRFLRGSRLIEPNAWRIETGFKNAMRQKKIEASQKEVAGSDKTLTPEQKKALQRPKSQATDSSGIVVHLPRDGRQHPG
jgi:hypothetical protein